MRSVYITKSRLSPHQFPKCTFSLSYFVAGAHQLLVVHTVMKYCVETEKNDFDGMGYFGSEVHDKIRAGGGEIMRTYTYIQGGYKVFSLISTRES